MTDGEFKSIDPTTYVDWNKAQWAQKSASVKAEFVEEGTVVETVMADGHVETTNTAGPDGGYRTTNPGGEQYLVESEKFKSKYDIESARDDVYKPVWDPILVVKVTENVTFKAPWGEEMKIKAGGILVNAGDNDVYGIQSDEFSETYEIVSKPGALKPDMSPGLG